MKIEDLEDAVCRLIVVKLRCLTLSHLFNESFSGHYC